MKFDQDISLKKKEVLNKCKLHADSHIKISGFSLSHKTY